MQGKKNISDLKPFRTVAANLKEELKQRGAEPELKLQRMKKLNKMLMGLRRKRMCVIGARTSNGKSVMAINIAYEMILIDKKVMFLSLEMPENSIAERMFCIEHSVNNISMAYDKYNRDLKVREKFRQFENDPLLARNFYLSDCIGRDWAFVNSMFNQMDNRPDVVILDHIQEIRGTISQKQAIDDHIGRMRECCIRNNFALVVCSQVNRVSPADKDNKEPQLHHLKATGFLEESADQVILLHWPWHYDDSKPKDELLVNLAKNRYGLTGHFKMKFEPEYNRLSDFTELDEKKRQDRNWKE